MAEVLKEFANVALTATNFNSSGEYTVLTNNSTTQAVIKDINATSTTANSVDSNIILTNGITTIATGGPSTGFELIPQSGTLKVQFNPTLSAGILRDHSLFHAASNNGAAAYLKHNLTKTESQNYPVIDGSTYVPAFTNVATENTGPATYGTANVAWFFINKAETQAFVFVYDGNSTTNVSWCTYSSGTFGSWTDLGLGSYNYAALDPETEKMMLHTGTNSVRVWDLVGTPSYVDYPNAFTGMSPTPANKSSYAHSASVNGIFFTLPRTSYDNRVQYFDPATGNRGVITRNTVNYLIANNGFLAVCYNPTEKNYYILTKASTGYKMYFFNVDGVDGALSGDYTSTYIETNSGGHTNFSSTNRWGHGTTDGHFVFSMQDNKARITKPHAVNDGSGSYGTVVHTATTASNYPIAGPVLSKRSTGATIPLTQLKPIGLKVKVSGVEITGVS